MTSSLVEFPSPFKGLLMNAILVMLGLIYAHFRVSSVFKAGLDFGEKNLRRCRNLRAGDPGYGTKIFHKKRNI